MTTIHAILKEARQARDLTQEGVAHAVRERTGQSFSRVSLAQLENGKVDLPRGEILPALCDVLGIDLKEAKQGRLVWVSLKDKALAANLDTHQLMALQLLEKLSPTQQAEWFAWAIKQDEQNQELKAWLLKQGRVVNGDD